MSLKTMRVNFGNSSTAAFPVREEKKTVDENDYFLRQRDSGTRSSISGFIHQSNPPRPLIIIQNYWFRICHDIQIQCLTGWLSAYITPSFSSVASQSAPIFSVEGSQNSLLNMY
jgi:hypothetical protein